MTRDETPIIDLDSYRHYPCDPADFPAVEFETEFVDLHPEDECEYEDFRRQDEIVFLRKTVAALTANANRGFDRMDIALAVALGVVGTVLAILLFVPN